MTRWKVRRFGVAGKYWWGAYLTDWTKYSFENSWHEAMAHVERETA